MKYVDLVVCAYNEQDVIDLFMKTVLEIADNLALYSFKIIVTNDGSKDATLEKLLAWHKKDKRVEVVNLSRNFGHEAALAAGLKVATGDAIIVMDADLEDPPELITELISKWNEGFDVVNAHRSSRKEDSFLKRWTAQRFYRTINSLSGKIHIPENVGNYRLISRRVLDILNALPEKNRVFRVLVPFLGFPTAEVSYARPKRPAGATHYNWNSMVRLAIDGITSATIVPLKFAINSGFILAAVGFLYMLWVIIQTLVWHGTAQGWASTMSVILFIGGMQMIFLGVIGEYIGRIFLEVKNRPDHVIDKHWKADDDSTHHSSNE